MCGGCAEFTCGFWIARRCLVFGVDVVDEFLDLLEADLWSGVCVCVCCVVRARSWLFVAFSFAFFVRSEGFSICSVLLVLGSGWI